VFSFAPKWWAQQNTLNDDGSVIVSTLAQLFEKRIQVQVMFITSILCSRRIVAISSVLHSPLGVVASAAENCGTFLSSSLLDCLDARHGRKTAPRDQIGANLIASLQLNGTNLLGSEWTSGSGRVFSFDR
jgi:hypothetical protein